MNTQAGYSAYDEVSGIYIYYQSYAPPKLRLPGARGRWLDYREVEIVMGGNAIPVGSGVGAVGAVINQSQVPCMPPCTDTTNNQAAWSAFLWGIRFLFF